MGFYSEKYSLLENQNQNYQEEIFKIKKDIANISLEKSFVEFKFKEEEKKNKFYTDNLLENNNLQEKKLIDLDNKISCLVKQNKNYEKELFKMNEISKLNENLKLSIIKNEKEISSFKKEQEKYLKIIENFKKDLSEKNENLKISENEFMEKINYSSNKITNYEKEIKFLNLNKNEMQVKLENFQINLHVMNNLQKDFNSLNYKLYNYENEIRNKNEEKERIKEFIRINIFSNFPKQIEENKINLSDIFENSNNINNIQFDHFICLTFKRCFF